MESKIGIIGPKDSVDKIMEVTKEFQKNAKFYSLVYSEYNELENLFLKNQNNYDLFLFSGEAPYRVLLDKKIIKKPTTYIPREGTSFYRTVWKIQNSQGDFKCLSSDIVSESVIDETMEELEISYDKTYFMKFTFGLNYNFIIENHKKLWKLGKIDAVVTGFSHVYEALNKIGIKVYKVYPTKSLIRESLNRLILLGKMKKEQEAQIAVQIVKIRVNEEKASSAYTFMLLRNEFEKNLILYTQENFGAMFPLGRDEYVIFTNRGSIENVSEILKSQFEKNFQQLIFSSGIGFGHTIYDAEVNARSALFFSMKKNYNCIYIKDEKGVMTGPLSKESDKWLSYNLEAGKNKEIAKIAKESKLSLNYISKLKGLTHKLNRDTFDANSVADYLGISTRSARRILSILIETNYAQVDYSKSNSKTGRPRKIYKLKF